MDHRYTPRVLLCKHRRCQEGKPAYLSILANRHSPTCFCFFLVDDVKIMLGQTPAGLAMSSPGTLPLGTRQWPSNQLTCRCLSRAAAGSALALACSKQRTPAGPGGWRRSRGISEAETAREAQGGSCAANGVARPRRRAAAAALAFESPRAAAGGPGPGLSRKAGVPDFRPLSKPTRPIDGAAGHAGRRRWQ